MIVVTQPEATYVLDDILDNQTDGWSDAPVSVIGQLARQLATD